MDKICLSCKFWETDICSLVYETKEPTDSCEAHAQEELFIHALCYTNSSGNLAVYDMYSDREQANNRKSHLENKQYYKNMYIINVMEDFLC